MKRTLLSLGVLLSGGLSFAQTADCSELFISEYLEGRGNNRALEIYNPTNADIDLSQYMVIRYSNGASTASVSNAVQLTGTITANSVYVAVVDKRDPNGTGYEQPIDSLLMDLADGFYCPVYNTNDAFYWNGNDAVVLAKGTPSDIGNSIAVDIFGKIGENPGPNSGWSTAYPHNDGSGTVVTEDYMLQRKSTILKGVTDPNITYFNPLTEYDSVAAPKYIAGGTLVGSYNSLGYHSCGCGTTSVEENMSLEISIFPNPSNGNFFVKGEVANVSVINALGQKVTADTQTTSMVTEVKIPRKKGVYFVKVVGINGQEVTERVIIK